MTPASPYHYDCGVVLDEAGNFVSGNREPLNDHLTAYLLLITHWGAMSMATLLLPEAHRQLYGPVLSTRGQDDRITFRSDKLWLREFIQQRVNGPWVYMRGRMGCTCAEVTQIVAETLVLFQQLQWSDASVR